MDGETGAKRTVFNAAELGAVALITLQIERKRRRKGALIAIA